MNRGIGSFIASLVLVFVVPLLAFGLIGLVTGSENLGSRELTLLAALWTVGLALVVWTHRRRV